MAIKEPTKITEQKYLNNIEPVVSISCITYNHVNFIRQCLEGFLKQKTDFRFEVLIHDDASTDGTEDIIRQYEAKYPQIIKPLYEKENQWQKGRIGSEIFNFPRAKGKYIALCEGDDYWTDPYKLQKQVDFLEANQEYNLCVSGSRIYNEVTKEERDEIKIIPDVVSNKDGYTFSLYDTKEVWLTKTLTSVFRNDNEIFKKLSNYRYGRDIHLFYHILKQGKGYYFTEIFGVYRIHEGGVESMKQGKINSNASYNCYKELYLQNKDEYTRYNLFRNTLGLLNFNLNNPNESNGWKKNLKLFCEAAGIISDLSEIKLLILCCMPNKLKIFLRR